MFWDEDRVNREMEGLMVKAYQRVSENARKMSVPMRRAAYMLGVGRVAEALSDRGLYP